jgi:hypothetical protein
MPAFDGRHMSQPGFEASYEQFAELVGFMAGDESTGLSHGEIEQRLATDGRELLRQLFQDHLDLRATNETAIDAVADAGHTARPYIEVGHTRALLTVFGEVVVDRYAYRAKNQANLHPADGALNLPPGRHSHGLARLSAVESSRGSFDEAVTAIGRCTGVQVGKRQVEQLARASAADFDDFYSVSPRHRCAQGDVMVISADGKGIVMRHEALREATAKAAAASAAKLETRVSKGEKKDRKRMATVGSVYEVTLLPRTSADIMAPSSTPERERREAPKAKNKWLTASVAHDAAAVVASLFDEAQRRDPAHARTWVALVDGNCHQIDRIKTEAAARNHDVTIVIDFIHVLEYLWSAAWSFFPEGDPQAERWVMEKATAVLDGKASTVAASIRRKATTLRLDANKRAGADKCAKYLLNKQDHLAYPTALTNGWPIATGIIEGACRHLVKDRLDITGARWGLDGAEAILKLRAIRSNGDFDDYWNFHINQERHRVHESRYANSVIPKAA